MLQARRFKLWAGLSYAVLLLAVAIPALLALRHAYEAAERRDHVSAEATAAVLRAVRLQETALRLSSAARAYLISSDAGHRTAIEAARDGFAEQVESLREDTRRADGQDGLARVERAAHEYVETLERMAALRSQAPEAAPAELALLFEQGMVPRQQELNAALGDFISLREKHQREATVTAQAAFRRALQVSSAIVLLGLLAGLGLGVHAARTLAHRYRAQREASRQAQEAVSARDELLGVVAHDLRSPLAAISLKAAVIQQRQDLARALQDAASIASIAERMEALIKSLLDVALIEKGQLVLKTAPTRVRSLFDAVEEIYASQAAMKAIHMTSRLDDPELEVLADAERMLQALGNVVGNAVKFTPAGGEVAVSARQEGEVVRITVRDTGPGIAPDDRRHVFERFWKGRKLGAGLGLFIARTIVEAHGGRIYVQGAPGGGSRFSLELPRSRPNPPSEAAAGRR